MEHSGEFTRHFGIRGVSSIQKHVSHRGRIQRGQSQDHLRVQPQDERMDHQTRGTEHRETFARRFPRPHRGRRLQLIN